MGEDGAVFAMSTPRLWSAAAFSAVVVARAERTYMRILRTMIVPVLGLIGLMPMLGGCHDHDDRRAWDRDERRAYPAGYRYGHDDWHRDRDWDHDRWRDRDDWRR
jgi:hypothetical protein